MQTQRLAGKVAFVTGGGSSGPGWGIGKATAVLFARHGATLFLLDINERAVSETRSLIEAEGGRCSVCIADVTRAADVERAVSDCLKVFGRIDVLDNNVGTLTIGGPLETSEADWDRVVAVNLKSVFLTNKFVLPVMLRQGAGSIINISSIASCRFAGVPFISYSVTKAGINQFTKHVALQYADQGIRSNCILPGLIDTPMARAQTLKGFSETGNVEELLRKRDALSPTGKQGTPWDIAHAALYLASDEAAYVNGMELIVDGGAVVGIG